MLLFFVKTTTFTEKESLCTCFLSHIAALSHIVGLWMTDRAICSTHGASVTLSLVATCWSAHHQLPASSLVASLSTQQSALHQLSSARQSRPKINTKAQLGRTLFVPGHHNPQYKHCHAIGPMYFDFSHLNITRVNFIFNYQLKFSLVSAELKL